MAGQKHYKDTINLPRTDFPMKGNLPQREPEILRRWKEERLYDGIRRKGQAAGRKFILHDGPPYANGHIHIGHALNKVLKDIIVKYKAMRGWDAHYLPGWDCHGLPIELQALKEMGKRKDEVPQVEFRKQARKYAEKYITIQRDEFTRLGVFGDWERPYLTMSYEYQAVIAESFLKLFEEGYIERRLKPVPWCYDCETALADAELEYEDRKDISVYVAFAADTAWLRENADKEWARKPFSYLIWTTTPWTLPANVGLAFHPELFYVLAKTERGIFLLAESLAEPIRGKLQFREWTILARLEGSRLKDVRAQHPFVPRVSRGILAEYVSSTEGTGIVHIAPGHGEDDYLYGHLKHRLEILSPVDEKGRFTGEFEYCEGMNVFKANAKIVELLKEKNTLLLAEDYDHSYPHCWRCKKPIVFRATRQWFLKIDERGLRSKLLETIQNAVAFYPSWGKNRIGSMVESRPDWCLSRQRFWGVPIPVLACKSCGKNYVRETREAIVALFKTEGADAWFQRPASDFLSGAKLSCCGSPEIERETDIIDVWFDSGVSHQAVLKRHADLTYPCDLYLEGSDQHRGWFQVSLITGVALDGVSPFRAVLTHGFVVDGEGKKMSKSRGNVISPQDVLKEFGADVLRLWVSSCDYQFDVRLSKEILSRMVEAYRRLRNTFRYLLANLYDFDFAKDAVAMEKMDSIDQWIMGRLAAVLEETTQYYEAYEFYQIYKLVHEFCTVRLSNFYLDVLKDRMYTAAPKSHKRRSSQTAFYHLLKVLVKLLAPILPFTTEEVWNSFPGSESKSVHESDWPTVDISKISKKTILEWDNLLRVREIVNPEIEAIRMRGAIGSSLECEVILTTPDRSLYELLSRNREDLPMAFVASQVHVENKNPDRPGPAVALLPDESRCSVSVEVRKAQGRKCERCWNYSEEVGENPEHTTLCGKCVAALAERISLAGH